METKRSKEMREAISALENTTLRAIGRSMILQAMQAAHMLKEAGINVDNPEVLRGLREGCLKGMQFSAKELAKSSGDFWRDIQSGKTLNVIENLV